MNASWSALDSTLLWTWVGMIASKKADIRPARLPNVSLPRKNTGTTVRAPQKAVDHTNMNPTASLTDSNRSAVATAGSATDML